MTTHYLLSRSSAPDDVTSCGLNAKETRDALTTDFLRTDCPKCLTAQIERYSQAETPQEFTEAPPPLPGLGLPMLSDRQLLDLAETLDNVHIRWCIRVLAHNRTSPEVRAACRRDLRAALGMDRANPCDHPLHGTTFFVRRDRRNRIEYVSVRCNECRIVLHEAGNE
jgi:ribosomal protein S27E